MRNCDSLANPLPIPTDRSPNQCRANRHKDLSKYEFECACAACDGEWPVFSRLAKGGSGGQEVKKLEAACAKLKKNKVRRNLQRSKKGKFVLTFFPNRATLKSGLRSSAS